MDIDSPPAAFPDPPASHHTHLNLPSFSASFPLPFRVLFLVGLAQLLWASNLHILYLLGLDTSWILDFRDTVAVEDVPLHALSAEDVGDEPPQRESPISRPESKTLHRSLYKLFAIYTAWVGSGWLIFRSVTGADQQAMENFRWFVGLVAIGAILGAFAPWDGIGIRDRAALKRAVRRIFLPSLAAPIFFSDVILADIFTSFAKVLGDLWISSCQILQGGITRGRVAQTGFSRYFTLVMVCLPYILRFRQCVLESYQSGWTSTRPLFNALKYFSAFPVIILSAAQKSVAVDVAASKGLTVQQLAEMDERWFGEHRLFRLWLLAVVVNSMYSFWWDVQMDWGLALCDVDTWIPKKDSRTSGRPDLSLLGRIRRLFSRGGPSISEHQRSPYPTPSPSFTQLPQPGLPTSPVTLSSSSSSSKLAFFAFGLRPTLLLPDPLVYHLFALIDLVLRFTWSLKLSSHLHTISEIESGVFMMEALELIRRWMWVFIRMEWEAVKMTEARRAKDSNGAVLWEQKDGP
ncbi:EXS family-domain-containing protein [Kockovaella imperatae]|uniref:EXS family-domain-containing protein n=1 Tax=Kockovaella imperatae TaxID=4999 RepID=A0A1Y1U7B7_9TREE|nr:EXS family-domain-containing protein [Kockovaella imperatae]ORX33919.1 EXS family-domain-containing protein [Kockovaella imperatae]